MTNITILGATGKTGRHVLTKALESGLKPTVLVRDPAKLPGNLGETRVLTGDLMDTAAVAEAIKGADAVISAAGPVKGGNPAFLSTAVKNVLEAMASENVSRLVWLTGAGVIDSRDGKDFLRPMIRTLMKIAAGKVLAESEKAYSLLMDSKVDYTVVRAPVLSENPGGAELEAGYRPPKPTPISREDLADFMLECLRNSTFLRESPMVGVKP